MRRTFHSALTATAIGLLLVAAPLAAQTQIDKPRVQAGSRLQVDRNCKPIGKLVGGMCIYPKIEGSCLSHGSQCTEVYGEDTCRCPQLN